MVPVGEERNVCHHHEPKRTCAVLRAALVRHLQLGSVRDTDWVAAHFGHR